MAQSGFSNAERYFRADMLARPYRFLKFNGTSGWIHTMTVIFSFSYIRLIYSPDVQQLNSPRIRFAYFKQEAFYFDTFIEIRNVP